MVTEEGEWPEAQSLDGCVGTLGWTSGAHDAAVLEGRAEFYTNFRMLKEDRWLSLTQSCLGRQQGGDEGCWRPRAAQRRVGCRHCWGASRLALGWLGDGREQCQPSGKWHLASLGHRSGVEVG